MSIKGTFEICDYLDHDWHEELVGFVWEQEFVPVVCDAAGREVPVQLADGKLWFVVDHLPANGSVRYEWQRAAAPARFKPCASVRCEQRQLTISNGSLAVRVPAGGKVRAGTRTVPGPIIAVRRGRGPWIGKGVLKPNEEQAIDEIVFEALAEGPLWCAYRLTYLAGERAYSVSLRLDAGQSFLRIDEQSHLGYDAFWEFDLAPGLQPTQAAYGHHSTSGRTKVIDLEYSGHQHLGDLLAPEQQINFFTDDFDAFSFLGKRQSLSLCATHDGDWTYAPDNPISMIPAKGNKMIWRASCRAGVRRWLLCIDATREVKWDGHFSDTPIRRLRRRDETTLDWVKDLVLTWDEIPARQRPHAVASRDDLKRARRLFREFAPLRQYGDFLDRDAELVQGQFDAGGHYPLDDEHREDPVSAWLMKPDPKVAAIIGRGLLTGIRIRVSGLLGPHGHRAPLVGSINMGRTVRPFAQIYDMLGPQLKLSEKEHRYLKAGFAFLAYKANDRNYWNVEGLVLHSDHPRSYHRAAWFPNRESDYNTYNIDTAPHNFHIDVYSAMGCVGMTFPNHPASGAWIDQAVSYVERELDNWIFSNGAFIESATYTLATMLWWVPFFAGLQHIRRKNYFLDERFQRMCRGLVRVLGPYDRRIDRSSFTVMGDAMYPSGAGNVLAWVAHLAREDREFSALMMGAWLRTGRQLSNPGQQGLSMYDAIYIDPELPAEPCCSLPSEHVDGLGLILRSNHGQRCQEVYFFIKCGKIYSHFHFDEGSFFFFADGVPVMDEYGVQYGSGTDERGETVPGNSPHLHNGISFSETPTDRECYNRGTVTQFRTTAFADYAVCEMPVHLLHMRPGLSLWGFTGKEAPHGWWRRHILFIKPHAFFFHDELETDFITSLDLNFKADRWAEVAVNSRIYRGRYGTDIPVCINQPTAVPTRNRHLDMVANASSFPKFSTMQKVSQELRDNFYNQVSWHADAAPGTDYNWAVAWAKPELAPELRPLADGLPGATLTMTSGTVRGLITPWLQSAFEHRSAAWHYRGWAGAVTTGDDGLCYVQMNGTRIGVPGQPMIDGDGPFRATVGRDRLTIESSGTARWLTITGATIRRAAIDTRPLAVESLGRRRTRLSVPAGEHRIELFQ